MFETTRRHLFLAGFMGTGKTAVGRLVAQRLGWTFIDLDEMVESLQHRSIADIFKIEGEEAFRLHESRALRLAVISPHSVIALGGGTPLANANANIISATGRCWLLTASLEQIWERIQSEVALRPLLTSVAQSGNVDLTGYEGFIAVAGPLAEKRNQAYLRVADHTLDTTGKSVDLLAKQIVDEFEFNTAKTSP